MKMYLLGLVMLTAASVQARIFDNPILGDTNYYFPGAIKVNGTYYVVTSTTNTTGGQFPIHTSTDLLTWEAAGYIFYASNAPIWPDNSPLYEPKIHKIGSNFVVYFDALGNSSNNHPAGAATALHPLGPYTALDQPIQPLLNDSQYDPTIINDEASGELYLVWRGADGNITARRLNSDGLSYSSDQTTSLITPSLDWEDGTIWYPWYIRRGSYHYLLYTAGFGCSAGVARSSNALGPYEKLPNPILVSNSNYACTRDASVVKDLDDKGDVIFFTAYRRDDAEQLTSVLLASLGWDDDDWPVVEDF